MPALAVLCQLAVLSIVGQVTPPPDPSQVPKAPPPRVQDLSAPPKILLPGPDNTLPPELEKPLTADEAALIALRLQPSLGIQRGNLVTAHGRTTQVQSGLFPQVSAGAGYNKLGSLSDYGVFPTQSPTGFGLSSVSPVDALSGALQVRQLVFDFNLTRNLVRQSRALEEVAYNSLSQAQSDVVFNVKSAFYTYAYSEQLVDVNQQNLENRQRQLDLTQSRMRNGVGLPSDVVTAQTEKSQAILALNIARDNAIQAKVSLLTQMGVDPLTPINVEQADESLYSVEDPKPLLKTALARRPEIRAAEKAVLASKYGVSAARAVDSPTVFAGAAAGSRGQTFPLNDSTFSLQIGLQIPILDGGERAGAVQASKGQLTAAQAQLDSTVLSVRQEVTSAYLSLKSSEQRVVIADNEVANAREGVRIAEGRYRSGLGLFLDITTAQALLLGALTDQNLAHQALNLAKTRVRFATGETLDLVGGRTVGR